MALTTDQEAALRAEAQRRGIDPDALVSEAEKLSGSQDGGGSGKPSAGSADQPKLFMYLLPFVTVREVRQVWLGLTDSFPGDSQIASKWAAEQGGNTSGGGAPPDQSA